MTADMFQVVAMLASCNRLMRGRCGTAPTRPRTPRRTKNVPSRAFRRWSPRVTPLLALGSVERRFLPARCVPAPVVHVPAEVRPSRQDEVAIVR